MIMDVANDASQAASIHRLGPLLVIAGIALAQSAGACDRPTLISPPQQVIGEASPRLEWSAVADASHFLVRVESRVPEGRLLWREEFRTAATFVVVPRPLTADKATVKLSITAVCTDNTQAETTTRLRIDTGLNCRIDSQPRLEQGEGKPVLTWNALPAAQSYEVRAHSAMDGKPEVRLETTRTAANLEGLARGLWVLAVQPRCGASKGESRYLMAAIR